MAKKQNKSSVIFMWFVAWVLCFSGSGFAKDTIELKAGGISPPTADVSKAMEFFVKQVAEKSKDKLKVNFYPAAQLGNGPTQLENVTTGAQDIFCSSIAWVGRLVKDYAIIQLPYGFRDYEHLQKFMEGSVSEGYRQELRDKWKMRIIAYNFYRLPRVIFAKKPIFKLEDMKGLKFRMADLPMYKKYIPAWGASPTTVSWNEYYLALKQGIVDMGESCAENIFNMKFYEAAPYITMLDFNYDFQVILINEKRFSKLSPELQDVLLTVGKEAGDHFNDLVVTQFKKDRKKMMSEGAAFIEVDTKPWEDTIPGLATQCENEGFWSKGLYEKIRQIK